VLVGIDLGTTNSALAFLGKESLRPDLLTIAGHRIIPSVVSFESVGARPLVGHAARNRFVLAPEATIREAKRNMGQDVLYEIHGKAWQPPQIQAEILKYLVREGSAQLGETIDRAVITVPAYFSQKQREETRRSGELAGLKVERLLNEPTAAALAYHPEGGVRNVLVYDLGGGTFDVSLVRMDGRLLEVQASHGDTALGGRDFDQKLSLWLLHCFAEEQELPDGEIIQAVRESPAAMARLLIVAEETKIELSEVLETTARCEFFLEYPYGQQRHLAIDVSREDLEALIREDLLRTLSSIHEVLDSARCTHSDVDEVLMVGGSTRIPAVAALIEEHLGMKPSRGLNADECVALGAAVQTGIMENRNVDKILVDVAPYPLSIAVLNQGATPFMSCRILTPRNTPLPARFSERFAAISAEQQKVQIHVFQGGHIDPRHNRCIGRLDLKGLKRRKSEPAPAVHVTFRTNLDGIIEVTVSNPASGKKNIGHFVSEGSATKDMMDDFLDGLDGIQPNPPGSRPPEEKRVEAMDSLKPLSKTQAEPEALPDWFANVDIAVKDDALMLRRIRGELPRLLQEHPDEQETLRESIELAKETIMKKPIDLEAIREKMDSLSDLLFDLGEFL
jgi:molecular chaperone DnaK